MNNDYEDLILARAYIKIQHFNRRWEPLEGLLRGTIFPELYRPYPKNTNEPEEYSFIDENLADTTPYQPRYYREHTRPAKKSGTSSMRGGKRSGKR